MTIKIEPKERERDRRRKKAKDVGNVAKFVWVCREGAQMCMKMPSTHNNRIGKSADFGQNNGHVLGGRKEEKFLAGYRSL